MLNLISQNAAVALNLTSDNIYTLVGAGISAVILMTFGVLSKHYITYKRMKFEIMHDIAFTQKFWGETSYNEAKDCENAKNILKQDCDRFLKFIETLPKGSLMRIGVPQPEVLRDIAADLMTIADSISEKGISEGTCEKNKAVANGIKAKFGIKN